jgi:hypothetical protein
MESELNIEPIKAEVVEYDNAEWCFQFDGDQPVVFAWTQEGSTGPGELTIQIKPNSHSNILFISEDRSKQFKIFTRPKVSQDDSSGSSEILKKIGI